MSFLRAEHFCSLWLIELWVGEVRHVLRVGRKVKPKELVDASSV